MEFTLNPCILPFRRRIWWKYTEKIMWKWCTCTCTNWIRIQISKHGSVTPTDKPLAGIWIIKNLRWSGSLGFESSKKNMQIRILLIKKEASNPNTMFSHGWYSDPHFSRSFSGSATMSTYRKKHWKKCRFGI